MHFMDLCTVLIAALACYQKLCFYGLSADSEHNIYILFQNCIESWDKVYKPENYDARLVSFPYTFWFKINTNRRTLIALLNGTVTLNNILTGTLPLILGSHKISLTIWKSICATTFPPRPILLRRDPNAIFLYVFTFWWGHWCNFHLDLHAMVQLTGSTNDIYSHLQ